MTCFELVILILVVGLVSMIEICVILGGVSRMIDAKTDAKIKLTTSIFENELKYMDKLFDKYFTRIEQMVDKITDKN